MLKIYVVSANHGEIEITRGVDFEYGQASTGLDGYGNLKSGNLACEKANYIWHEVESFVKGIKDIERNDGFGDMLLWNPYTKAEDIEATNPSELHEEAILLFTKFVDVAANDFTRCERLAGRWWHTSCFVLYPGAQISFQIPSGIKKNYDVIQTFGNPKEIHLVELERFRI
jgi:hypothetical protein